MSEELPELSDREIVQLMAAQKVVSNHHDELGDEYKEQVKKYAERYDVEVSI